ncbi:MAG: hypothetical protein R3E79_47630 [Caldilineaceae bacterium]
MKLSVILASFIIVMLFLVVLATFLERYWREYQTKRATTKTQADNEPEAKPAGVNRFTESVAGWTTQLRSMLQPGKQDAELVKQFRTWIERDLTKEQSLQSWLLALPEAGFALLTEHIAAFCQEMNFDLQWLVTQQVEVAPDLKAAMQAVIVEYCQACQKAVPVQTQARLFAQYQRLLENPTGRQEQVLGRSLYVNLTTQGLAPTPAAAELINATDSERHRQTLEAIQQAAAKDWTQFAQILHTTIAPPTAGVAAHNGHNGNGKAPH